MSQIPSYIPKDPLYVQQLHFAAIGRLGHTSANTVGIERIWAQYTGQGVSVGIWDDGIQNTHWDLASQYDASKHVTVLGSLNNGQPVSSDNPHGTAVAGLIAAANNDKGGVGVAFNSIITGVTVFGGADDLSDHASRYARTLDAMRYFDVTNHSYGASASFQDEFGVNKFEAAVQYGRSGLGTLNIKAAGNERSDGVAEPLSATRFTITVAAITNQSSLHITNYSNYGSHLLVSAPAAAVTTDLMGDPGYNGLVNKDYTNAFSGTSAATPLVSGVISLMLEANPKLGWRDVYDILSYSAVGANSLYGSESANERFSWKWNAASNWNGGGLHFSEDYGFGVVNAFNAVRLAEVWGFTNANAKTLANEVRTTTAKVYINQQIPDRSTLTQKLTLNENIAVEHVSLTIALTQSQLKELRITLTSPTGTTLSVYDGSVSNTDSQGNLFYTFGLTGFRGEQSVGDWSLAVQDTSAIANGTLQDVTLTAYGAAISGDNVYFYTDEVLATLSAAGQSSRLVLVDDNGGEDWINAAAMHQNLIIDLNNDASSFVGGQKFLHIAAGDLNTIENVMAGDGNDTLIGNSLDNRFWGGRGNDLIKGGGGLNTSLYAGQATQYSITLTPLYIQVSDRSIAGEGLDTLHDVEFLNFNDRTLDTRLFAGVTSISADDLSLLTSIYIGYFNRAPDSEGLFYWGTRFSEDMSFVSIADSFFEQPETVSLYSNRTDTTGFVEEVYNNLLGRTPDELGLNYWVQALDSGSISKPTFILAVIYGANAPTGGADDAIYLDSKIDIGTYYATIQGMNDLTDAKEVMQLFDGSAESIQAAKNASDAFFEVAQQPNSQQILMSLSGVINDPFAGFV